PPAPPPVRPTVPGWTEVLAHFVGGLGIGAASGVLVLWTSPGFLLGIPVDQFDIINVASELVALAALGLALAARLRPYAWLIAAVGMLGLAGLYAQGDWLDGRSLVVGLIVVIALQFGGLLLAFAQASGRARWAVAVGLGAGLAAGRDALAWLVDALMSAIGRGDDVAFAGLGLVVAAAGVVLLVLDRRSAPSTAGPVSSAISPAVVRRVAVWSVAAVAVASVLAVGVSEVWTDAFRGMIMHHLGGISADDAQALQTWDHLVRVGLAVLVAAVLAAAAHRWGAPGTARWVATGLGAALLLVVLQGLVYYYATVVHVMLAAAGSLVGAFLARRAAHVAPWEAVGLLLGACLPAVATTTPLWSVGWFGFGFAVAAGATRLAGPGAGSPGLPGPATDLIAPAAGVGLAALLLGYQVVLPVAFARVYAGGDMPVVTGGVILAALTVVVFFALDRRRAA
ncbi:MAG: hypothetical protein IRY85_23255, partial [Micromonosporaceae bacterium]|nr:hypothetical protein [Micromonosporaceae bacterium]